MITLDMAVQERSDFNVIFTMSLCALGLKQLLIVCYFKSYGLDIKCVCSQKLFEANCEYTFHNPPNKKLVGQRIMVKTTSRSNRPWSAIFLRIVYCGEVPKQYFQVEKKTVSVKNHDPYFPSKSSANQDFEPMLS